MAPRIPLPSMRRTKLGNWDTTELGAAMPEARGAYYKEVYSMHRVDPVTRELGRMKNARFQECNL